MFVKLQNKIHVLVVKLNNSKTDRSGDKFM